MKNKQSSKCPKCGHKLSPFYMKQNCPKCNVNLLYYKMDEKLEADAQKAAREVEAVNNFFNMLKNSTVATPWLIIRLILFFTPLASMCLPMYWAGSKKVSLISFIMSIINHGLDVGAMANDLSYLFAVLAIIMVILLSLAVIIASLFSSLKNGFKRNLAFSAVNISVFEVLSMLVCLQGGKVMAGFYVTMLIYAAEIIMHCVVADKTVKAKKTIPAMILPEVCVVFVIVSLILPKPVQSFADKDYVNKDGEISVVSFNVAAPWGSSFDDTDSMDRCSRFIKYINHVQPDFIGTQEINSIWLDYIEKQSDSDSFAYDFYGVKRGGDSEEYNSEMNAVFWLKDKYTVIDKNTFWLSDTPDEESKYTYTDENGEPQEAGCNRICSYVVLKSNENNETYIHMNTHLDNASEDARVLGANVIISRVNALKEKYNNANIILSGDFNNVADSDAYKTLVNVFSDTTNKDIQKATYQEWGYKNTGDEPIDFIFTNGSGTQYEVLDDISGGYVSDHYGIFSKIKF